MAERRASVLEVAVTRAGIMKGARAADVVVSWTIAAGADGGDLLPGAEVTSAVRAHAEYWRQSERTSWRDLRRFREVFPEETSPARLAAVLLAAVDERTEARLVGAPVLVI